MAYDSAVAELDNLHRQARTARARLEPVWYLNLAYYMGEQWVAWDGRQLYRPSMPKNRITVVDNRVQPCVRTEIARMSKQRPVFTVTPTSPDGEDQNAAELGEQIMRYLWKHLNMQELSQKALHWSRICCAGFFKVYWDPTIGPGRDVLVGPSGNVLTGADGKAVAPDAMPEGTPGVARKSARQGDVRVEVRSPFQMFIDPLADTFEEAEWVIEESVKSREYVRRRYGVDIQPDTPANPGLIEARMGAVFMPGTGGYKGLKVREYWCKPNSEYPNGHRCVWVTTSGARNNKPSGQILFEDNAPIDPMPYVMLTGIPVPGRLWPTSVVEQLRGPQTELNKVKSQIAENRNRVGNPTILASKQAIQDAEKFISSTTAPGGVYFYDDVGSPNAKPDYLAAPPLPDYVVEEIQRIEESIQEISGQHEVTSAQVPPGVTAASAINLLQEADDTRLGPAIADYEYQLGKLGQKLLKLVAKYYTDARTIQLGGDNGAWQIFDFRGSMLRGNTHVEVQAGSAFPQSKAAKQAWIQDLLTFFVQSGSPPQGRVLAQFLADSQIGGAEKLVESYSTDEAQCNRENALMAAGKVLPINEYDDDESHVANHTDFQKQPRYTMLPRDCCQNIEMHVEAHRQRMAAHQQAQMQLAQQMQGNDPQQQQAQAQQQQQAQQQEMEQQEQSAQLDQAQQQQQMQMKDAQGAQQQGQSQAQAEQSQRQAEEQHQQKLRHAEEVHQEHLRRQQEQGQMDRVKGEQQRQQEKLKSEAQLKAAKEQAKVKRRPDGQS